ncbi:MAG: RND family transporter [Segniliparus sp.]|uniref:MMPL/RND family transporter n=1 Tax=Segniliparus sp. TaxID=2804064 RepID=UPI003F31A818
MQQQQQDSRLARVAGIVAKFSIPIVGLWILAAVALNLIAPSLGQVLAEHSSSIFPVNTESGAALKHMGHAFGESTSNNQSVLIVEKTTGPFDEADRQYRSTLVQKLKADKEHVESLTDTWSDPQLAAMSESPDKRVAFIQMNLAGDIGTPKALNSVQAVQDTIQSVPKPPGTVVYNAGMSQGAAEENAAIQNDAVKLGAVSALLIGVLLFLVYRSFWVAFLPLLTVGLALAVADPAVNMLVGAGLLPTTLFTNALMGALMMGACCDYSVFFIGRYQEGRRSGLSVDDAYLAAYQGIAPVVAASGLTVAGALACLDFTQLDMLRSMGTPCALGILASVVSALTVTPIVLRAGAKRFGLFDPKRVRTTRDFWRRTGVRIAHRPRTVFMLSMLPLLLLMLAIPTAELNYDELAFIPSNMSSSKGMAAVQKHFPAQQMYPDMVLIEATHDLRNSNDIGVLEQTAAQLTKLPDVNTVQWLTRPLGAPLDQTSLTYSAGFASSMLKQNLVVIKQRTEQMRQMTDSLGSMISTIDQLKGQLANAQQQTQSMSAQSARIAAPLAQLEKQIKDLRTLIVPVQASLSEQGDCATDAVCAGAKRSLQGLDQLDQLSAGLRQLTGMTASAQNGLALSASSLPLMENSLVQMRDMANSLNASLQPVASQLDTAADILQDLGRSSNGTGAYFYFPSQLLNAPQIKPYLQMMFSPDGKTTRMIVMGKGSSFSSVGMQRAGQLKAVTEQALKGTPLEGSVVSVSGSGAMIFDAHEIMGRDGAIIAVAALTVIFSIVLMLLGSVVAALIVIGSVVLSCMSTYGLSLFVWQHLLGVQLHWAVPAAVFAILISVGADYNLLVASRFREEMGAGVRTGVIRSVAGTGGVVTTAGMVFAFTQFAMLGASLVNLAQMGFTIGMGLVIDTFIVRTYIVPALAVLLGEKFWWPLRLAELKR